MEFILDPQKQKFEIGQLVRASSKMARSYYACWNQDSDGCMYYPPYGRRNLSDPTVSNLRAHDVGVVIKTAKPVYSAHYFVEVKFLQSGTTMIVKQDHLKSVK